LPECKIGYVRLTEIREVSKESECLECKRKIVEAIKLITKGKRELQKIVDNS